MKMRPGRISGSPARAIVDRTRRQRSPEPLDNASMRSLEAEHQRRERDYEHERADKLRDVLDEAGRHLNTARRALESFENARRGGVELGVIAR